MVWWLEQGDGAFCVLAHPLLLAQQVFQKWQSVQYWKAWLSHVFPNPLGVGGGRRTFPEEGENTLTGKVCVVLYSQAWWGPRLIQS